MGIVTVRTSDRITGKVVFAGEASHLLAPSCGCAELIGNVSCSQLGNRPAKAPRHGRGYDVYRPWCRKVDGVATCMAAEPRLLPHRPPLGPHVSANLAHRVCEPSLGYLHIGLSKRLQMLRVPLVIVVQSGDVS